MDIIIARTAGFCMGVKRAINLALETSSKKSNVYTCGPLIHNPQAVEHLKDHGINSINDVTKILKGTLIIRAHGMPKNTIESALNNNIEVVDATCPHVLTSQKEIAKYSSLGWFIAIIGDKNHPEILSLQSFAPNNHVVISTIKEAISFDWPEKVMVIAQTTFSIPEYDKISVAISNNAREVKICNSICKATFERQNEILELAQKADAVIVVGGKDSANTRRLAQISYELCKKTYHIETAQEINPEMLHSVKVIAVTAGASTPDFIMNEVLEKLQSL